MADFSSSVIIRKPLQDVFTFASNLENAPEFLVAVKKMDKLTDGPVQKGTKYLETRMIRGSDVQTELEFTEFEPFKSYTIRSFVNGLETLYHYRYFEVEEGTQVEFKADLNTKGLLMKLTKRALVKMIKKEDGNHLFYLKDLFAEKTEENI